MSAANKLDLDKYKKLIFELTGININETKRALLENRLGRRLRLLKLENYDQYYDLITQKGSTPGELANFIDAVTTNETYFFRTEKVWEYFAKEYLPEWFKSSSTGMLKIWCGAASSGEEPYTIGITCEEFKVRNPSFRWSLEASDISGAMLQQCELAQYSGRSIEKVSPHQLKTFFDKQPDDSYKVKAALKKNVQFFRHNLLETPPKKNFDIIFLRNVMIYFEQPVKEKVLVHMHSALKDGGILIVGESEGLIGTKSPFKYVKPGIYLK